MRRRIAGADDEGLADGVLETREVCYHNVVALLFLNAGLDLLNQLFGL